MRLGFLAIAGLVAALLIALIYGGHPSGYGEARIGGAFALTDTHGKTVRDTDFRGRLMLVYMGYSHCPDICPMTLARMSEALKTLGSDASGIAVIFITLDPGRDTPQALGSFLSAFDPRIIGLTGSAQAIDGVAKAYKAFYKKSPTPGGNYLVDHSGFLYLMDGQGKYIRHFESDVKAAELAEVIRRHF
jgi:protein SCO1